MIFFQIFRQRFEFFDFIREGCAFFENGFGVLRIVPESIFGNLLFNFCQTCFYGLKVKDSSAGLAVFVAGPLSFV